MPKPLPQTAQEILNWSWPQIEPYFQELEVRQLSAQSLDQWMQDWSDLSRLLYESEQRLMVATTVDTSNSQVEANYHIFLDQIFPPSQAAQQRLKRKLIDSGLEPKNFSVPLRNMRAEVELFRSENLPLLSEQLKLVAEYDKIIGAQTVQWEGHEVTLLELDQVLEDPDRAQRERAWRLKMNRWFADRDAINELWFRFMNGRRQLAANADCPDFRAYRWKQMLRFDYSPEDCETFHRAIETEVLPAAERLIERRRKRLGLASVRPWDLLADVGSRSPLRPFQKVAVLEEKTAKIFVQVDPQLGEYFDVMRREGYLDLDNRKNKAPGGYCTEYTAARRPFIFANAVGIQRDVETLVHEGGHAFHVFESNHLPYFHQLEPPMEFAEVASMAMEFLVAPYYDSPQSFYTPAEAARARIDHLEQSLLFWPYMAVVDAFQHWVYTHHDAANSPQNCDAKWVELWGRFMSFVDWSGLEGELAIGWHRKGHIHQDPFYYIEYGLAQMGAVQVWRNSLSDPRKAVDDYRRALSLGGTRSLPELYSAVGARFAFDPATLGAAVGLVERTIYELEAMEA